MHCRLLPAMNFSICAIRIQHRVKDFFGNKASSAGLLATVYLRFYCLQYISQKSATSSHKVNIITFAKPPQDCHWNSCIVKSCISAESRNANKRLNTDIKNFLSLLLHISILWYFFFFMSVFFQWVCLYIVGTILFSLYFDFNFMSLMAWNEGLGMGKRANDLPVVCISRLDYTHLPGLR